jgi:hypothetical protein
MMLRPLHLPTSLNLPGKSRVFLSEMPGRQRRTVDDLADVDATGIDHVLCLTGLGDSSSYEYLELIKQGYLKAKFHHCPLSSLSAVRSKPVLADALGILIEHLRDGESVLIHCQYGEVRTGCAAAALLILLGLEFEDALATVRAAGSDPEFDDEAPLLRAFL